MSTIGKSIDYKEGGFRKLSLREKTWLDLHHFDIWGHANCSLFAGFLLYYVIRHLCTDTTTATSGAIVAPVKGIGIVWDDMI